MMQKQGNDAEVKGEGGQKMNNMHCTDPRRQVGSSVASSIGDVGKTRYV
jgi:hypothetical protein